MSNSWNQIDLNEYLNDSDLSLIRINGVWTLVSNNLEEEGLTVEIPLEDLFNNPVMPVVYLDPDTGRIPEAFIPTITLGSTYYIHKLLEITDPTKYRDSNDNFVSGITPIKGDVVILIDTTGGASFRLMQNDFTSIGSWAELVARFALWSNVRNKPPVFPPDKHDHPEYPEMELDGNGQYKIPTKYLGAISIGNIIYCNSVNNLPLSSISGTFAFTKQDGIFGFISDGISIPEWHKITLPGSGVFSINGQVGIVSLNYQDVQAASESHTHDIRKINSLNEYELDSIFYPFGIQFKYKTNPKTSKEALSLIINDNEEQDFLVYQDDLDNEISSLQSQIDGIESNISGYVQDQLDGLQSQITGMHNTLDSITTLLNTLAANNDGSFFRVITITARFIGTVPGWGAESIFIWIGGSPFEVRDPLTDKLCHVLWISSTSGLGQALGADHEPAAGSSDMVEINDDDRTVTYSMNYGNNMASPPYDVNETHSTERLMLLRLAE
jgi:hypothetical protein